MSAPTCPQLEAAWLERFEREAGPATEHARGCALCTAALAEHDALDLELRRLEDATPPLDFASKVMARVDQVRATRRGEVRRFVWIFSFAAMVALVTTVAGLGHSSPVVVRAVGLLLGLPRQLLVFGGALSAVWGTLAIPLSVCIALTAMAAILVVRRTLLPTEARR